MHNFASGCEVGDMLVRAARFRAGVRDALALHLRALERQGLSHARGGEAIPLPMRIVHLSHDMEAIGRLFSPERAVAAAARAPRPTYDPALADLFVEHGDAWFERLARDRAVGRGPRARARATPHAGGRGARRRARGGGGLHRPQVAVHGRAQPPLRAARRRRRPRARACRRGRDRALRPAALVHDFGTTAVPNSIWDKPGPLTRTEFDRVELHPMLTEQMLRRSPALAVAQPGRRGASRAVRRLGLPQAAPGRRRATAARACWPRPRSTSA